MTWKAEVKRVEENVKQIDAGGFVIRWGTTTGSIREKDSNMIMTMKPEDMRRISMALLIARHDLLKQGG